MGWEIFCKLFPKCSPDDELATLLHDGPEYVIGDMISPFKTVLGNEYKGVEARLQEVIHVRHGLPALISKKLKSDIKRSDSIYAYFEATELKTP